jgi:hypothetical protein
MNLIYTYKDFILNETLKTTNIDFTVKNVKNELDLLKNTNSVNFDNSRYNYDIQIINTPHGNSNNIQTISFTLFEVDKQNFIDTYLDNLNSLFIDRHGWFPSVMIITNKNNLIRKIKYNREELFNNINKLKELTLIYEAKYDDYELYNGVCII